VYYPTWNKIKFGRYTVSTITFHDNTLSLTTFSNRAEKLAQYSLISLCYPVNITVFLYYSNAPDVVLQQIIFQKYNCSNKTRKTNPSAR